MGGSFVLGGALMAGRGDAWGGSGRGGTLVLPGLRSLGDVCDLFLDAYYDGAYGCLEGGDDAGPVLTLTSLTFSCFCYVNCGCVLPGVLPSSLVCSS